MGELWSLTSLEWKRSRLPILGFFLLTVGLWGGVVFYFPVLRDGDMSADIVVFTTAILTGFLAFRAFAVDFGSGRLEFLFSLGASPSTVFLSKSIVCVTGAALFLAGFGLIESVRLHLTPSDLDYSFGPVYQRFRAVRESIYLYIVPLLGFMLFASAVSSRGSRLLAVALVVAGTCIWLDSGVESRALTNERLGFVEAAWSIGLVPFFVALAACAVWARRHESERTNVKVLFAAIAVLALGARHLSLESHARAPNDSESPRAVVLSPDRRQFAVESESAWRPSSFANWSSRLLEQSRLDKSTAGERHVFVGNCEGELWSVSPRPARLDVSGGYAPWMNATTLRIRAVAEGLDDGVERPFVVESSRRHLTDAPNHWIATAAPKTQDRRMPIPVKWNESPSELVKLSEGSALWVLPTGELELRLSDGTRHVLALRPFEEPPDKFQR